MEEENYYAEALKGAKKGNDSDARELLQGFLSAVEQKQPIPGPILEYLYAAFASYLSAKLEPKDRPGPLEKALYLTRGSGAPEGARIRVREGRIYTDVAIAALFNLLARRMARKDALAMMEEHSISPSRTTEQYAAENNSLKEWPPADLRRLIRDERELAKRSLDERQRQLVSQGRPKKRSAKNLR
jgi:hypothetical protein